MLEQQNEFYATITIIRGFSLLLLFVLSRCDVDKQTTNGICSQIKTRC